MIVIQISISIVAGVSLSGKGHNNKTTLGFIIGPFRLMTGNYSQRQTTGHNVPSASTLCPT